MPTYQKERSKGGWLISYDNRKVMPSSMLPVHLGEGNQAHRYAINLKGTNGSGKSTIIFEFLKTDPNWVYVCTAPNQSRPIAIYSPRFRTVILGVYVSKCGGCDAIGNIQRVKSLLKVFWKKDVNILFEGVIVGDIKSTFYELMKELRAEHHRWVHFCFMGTSLKTCLARVQERNGGIAIKEKPVRGKYKNSMNQLKWYLAQGDVNCKVLSTQGDPRTVFQRFLVEYPMLGAMYAN